MSVNPSCVHLVYYTLYTMFPEQKHSRCVEGTKQNLVLAFRERVFRTEFVTSAIAKAGNVLCKAGVLRLLCLQGFRMTHDRACQFSGEENKLCDLTGSLTTQDKIITLRSKLEANKKRVV